MQFAIMVLHSQKQTDSRTAEDNCKRVTNVTQNGRLNSRNSSSRAHVITMTKSKDEERTKMNQQIVPSPHGMGIARKSDLYLSGVRYRTTNAIAMQHEQKRKTRVESSKIPPRTTNRLSGHPRCSRSSGMVARRRSTSNTGLIARRRNSRAIMTVAILLSLRRIRRMRSTKITTISTCIGLIRVFLHLTMGRLGKHGLGCLIAHAAHLHIGVLLTQSAALTPAGHGRESIFIEGFIRGRGVKTSVLWLLRAVDRGGGRLVLGVLRELRDWGWWLCVSLVAVVAVSAARGAAGETRHAAATAFDAAAEAAYKTPDDREGYHHSDDDTDDYWPSRKERVSACRIGSGRSDSLAVCLAHTLIPSRKGVFDVRHLGRHISHVA